MNKVVLGVILIFTVQLVFSQQLVIIENDDPIVSDKINSRKGQFFASWGWNRGYYTTSDIQFKGDNYDFTLSDVKADDRQTPFGIRYFSPGDLTIPQTNYRMGYFFKDNYNAVLGVDHMKYVMRQDQTVKIDGEINSGHPDFDGTYTNDNINLSREFLIFEHTDGLNYVFVAVNRFDNFNKLLGINTPNFEVNLEEGIDIGVLYPKTNATLLGGQRHDDFHISGFGFSAKAGLNLTFFKHFFLQSDLKYGYINMPNIRTTHNEADTANQHFGFFEVVHSFGWRFNIK